MARVQNTLIGKSSGSVGGATFSTWKGLNVLKSKPETVANPQSDNQLMRRSAMSQMVAIFRRIPAAVDAGFKKLAIHMSAFNAFTSYNLKNAFDYSTPPDASILEWKILISKGTITPTTATSSTKTNGSPTITVAYPTAVADPGQSADDKVIVVCYNATQDNWGSAVGTATRADGTVNVTMPTNFVTGDDVYTWLAFYNELSGESSDSTNDVPTP
jgi:hypothetical protein